MTIRATARRALSIFRRQTPQTLSEWADEHFYLSSESSYIEGKWRTLPEQKGIMDAISNDDVQDVNVQKSARVGYTKIILAAMGYFATHKRRNQIVWQPADGDAEEFTKIELEPAIRDVPMWRDAFPSFERKSKENTLSLKIFEGVALHIKGGQSGKNYRRLSADVGYLDELDGFVEDVDKEGDPVTLAAKRTENATYPKNIRGTTPKTKEMSQILPLVEASEMRVTYQIPCPSCGERHPLTFGGVDSPGGLKWDKGRPETVRHACPHCAVLYTQTDYIDASDAAGRWQADDGEYLGQDGNFYKTDGNRRPPPRSIGFQIWTGYNRLTSWAQIIRDFLAAKDDPRRLKTFVNTTLGEAWEEPGERVEVDDLYDRRETYQALPDEVVVLTAGVDVQDDRLEVEVVGWGEGAESWGVEHRIFFGSPSQSATWAQLHKALGQTYERQDGAVIHIAATGVDTGGHFTTEAYEFCRRNASARVYALKGVGGDGRPVVGAPKKNKTGRMTQFVQLFSVGTDEVKSIIMANLRIIAPGPGYCHFPEAYDREYFAQLTAEKRVATYRKGYKKLEWVKTRDRNEALDLRQYAIAALVILNPDYAAVARHLTPPDEAEKQHPTPDTRQHRRAARGKKGFSATKW